MNYDCEKKGSVTIMKDKKILELMSIAQIESRYKPRERDKVE